MKVRFFNYYSGNFRDKNQVELVYATGTGSYMDIVGSISLPTGTIILDSDVTNNVFLLQDRWIALNDGGKIPGYSPDLNFIVKVRRVTALDGVHVAVDYEVDWLRTWYNYLLDIFGRTATGRISPFREPGMRLLACSMDYKWNRWKNIQLPTSGNRIESVDKIGSINRITEDNYANQAFLIVYKSYNVVDATFDGQGQITDTNSYKKAPGITSVLVDTETLLQLLNTLAAGDYVTTSKLYFRPSKLLPLIEGIYFLPGITVDIANGTTNLVGVKAEKREIVVEYHGESNADPTDENYPADVAYINGITGKVLYVPPDPNNADAVNVIQISYYKPSDTSNFKPYAYFQPTLDSNKFKVTLNDFRDLYYKKYYVYLPYIGTIDIPIAKMCTYGNTSQSIPLHSRLIYTYDIYEGRISYRWQNLDGIEYYDYHNLPKIPISSSDTNFIVQQNNTKLGLSNLSSIINAGMNLANGNVNGVFSNIMNIGTNMAMNEIANNEASHGHLTSISHADFDGYTDTNIYYYTETIETDLIKYGSPDQDKFSEYMEMNGYPCHCYGYEDITSPTPLSIPANGYRVWLDPSAWTENVYYWFTPFSDQIRNQIQEMGYVHIVKSSS